MGSGSGGNGTLIEQGATRLLVDCGFSAKETRRRLASLEVDPASLTAILVTHEHGDHIGGVGVVARDLDIPVYITAGTQRVAEKRLGAVANIQEFSAHECFVIDGLQVSPFPVPHDARDPAQFVFGNGDRSVGLLTDAGHVSRAMLAALEPVDYLLLEFNHDRDMLLQGDYPEALKVRVDGDYGHLNNHQAAELLTAMDLQRLSGVVALHLSQQNNRPEKVKRCLSAVLAGHEVEQRIAD
ncbi:MAG: MBL fold metallo-hydrolase, partial [Gammaproteobacteria bacterium]